MKAKKVCNEPDCSILTHSRFCPQHTRIHDRKRGTAAERGYTGKAWERTRRRVFARDLYKCQSCGRLVMGKGEAHCDHIVPKEAGGSDDDTNLQTLCRTCHSRKTATEDGGFGR